MKMFKSVLLVGSAIAVLFGAALYVMPNLETFAGTIAHSPFSARVIDGDTLADGAQKYRLVGVDACEMGQPIAFEGDAKPLDCGFYAKSFVEQFIGENKVICYDQGTKSYDRIVARCFLAVEDGVRPSIEDDIGAFALHSGWAVATEQAKGMFAFRYIYEELAAKVSLRGAWNGRTMKPIEWRRSHSEG